MRAFSAWSLTALLFSFAPSSAIGQEVVDLDMAARIRAEGLERSQALDLYLTLSDEFGGRLSGAPAHRDAAEWARDRFAEWGLSEARLEPFEFGRGWSLEKLSVEMVSPRYMPLIAYAEAWTPSVAGILSGRAIYLGDSTLEEIDAMGNGLQGAIVLTRQPQTRFFDEDRPQPGLADSVRTGNPAGIPVTGAAPAGQVTARLRDAGAGVVLRPSAYRDGTVGVGGSRTTTNDAVPSIILAAEQYNMLARLASEGVPVELQIELRTR
jgi:hypothetical protein